MDRTASYSERYDSQADRARRQGSRDPQGCQSNVREAANLPFLIWASSRRWPRAGPDPLPAREAPSSPALSSSRP